MTKTLNIFFIHAGWQNDCKRIIADFQKLIGQYQLQILIKQKFIKRILSN